MSILVPWIIDTDHNSHWHYWKLTFLISKMIDTCRYLCMLGIIGISSFWFLQLFIFSRPDLEHDWYGIPLIHDLTDFGISHVWSFCYWTLSKIGGGCNYLLLVYDAPMLISAVYVIKSQVLGLEKAFLQNQNPRFSCAKINYD